MIYERWDTHQNAYLNYLAEKYGIPVLALHTPLHRSAWGLDPSETLVCSVKLAGRTGASVVVVHPPPLGRPLVCWATGPLKEAQSQGASVAV